MKFKQRHYMYLVTSDNYAHTLIKQALGESDRLEIRNKILGWLKHGLSYSMDLKENKLKRQPIVGIILKETDPFEKNLIKLKKKYGKKSTKLFINAICYSIKNGESK